MEKTLAAAGVCLMLAMPALGQVSKTAPQAQRGRAAASGPAKAPVRAAAPGTAPAPAPLREKPVPFRPGEVLTYDVSYSGAVSAGEATISVTDKRASYSSTAYYIVGEGKPTGLLARMYTLYYKADTLVDVFSLLPQRGSIYSLEGSRSRFKTTVFNQKAGKAEYEVKTTTLVKRALAIAPSTQDALSILVALRTAPLQAGARVTFPLCDGGRQYRVDFAVEGRETLATAALTAPAWRLKITLIDDRGQAQGRGLYIWVSDDARRVPMKLKAELAVGSFVLELSRIKG